MAKKRKERPRAATAEQMPSPAASTVSKIHKESKANASSILPAPPLSRLYAYVIDWILGGIVSGLPAVLAYLALTHKNAMLPDLYVFEAMGSGKYYGRSEEEGPVVCVCRYGRRCHV